ncbi:telomere silencing protein Zds1, putative [Trichophyton benhamiae CBS 112371]|uniref:Telomere silencing protein Zds1, putative n=1 Tax=Arthroderma benhamiae (strain ATCC MYA-4681 / CBS 112371) TaxID=663331 RepID=D4B3B9_ARTBC|nr:telomere silencing protein Zds1, putative [Trichophyton benhamiae CBS 112371]EFE30165.1 telomere silencing protein Zds1, putative [Trichophyton benhamiae CBS 112371]
MYNDAYDGSSAGSGSGSSHGNGSASPRDSKRLSYLSQEENLSTNPINRTMAASSSPGSASASGSSSGATKDRTHLPIRTSSINGVNGHGSTSRHTLSPNDSTGQLSPGRSHSSSSDGPVSFPLTDIDCQSDPATVAQELSNLAALRRMSMDVGSLDPDLPSFGGLVSSIAPSPSADEDDASRLFWVPAHLHPGLAPKEFKSFLDSKADQIQRRSGELSPTEGAALLQRQGSVSSLSRKKSLLSRQVDSSSIGREDSRVSKKPNLAALSEEPRNQFGAFADEDVPILPPAPPGSSLRRSRRTTYRKGSLKAGERVPHSRRAARQSDVSQSEDTADGSSIKRSSTPTKEPPLPGLTRVSTDPAGYDSNATNYSRPGRSKPGSLSSALPPSATETAPEHNHTPARASATSRTQQWASQPSEQPPASPHHHSLSQPQLQTQPIEPPRTDSLRSTGGNNSNTTTTSTTTSTTTINTSNQQQNQQQNQLYIPERNSSHHPPPSLPPQAPLPPEPATGRTSKRAGLIIPTKEAPPISDPLPKIVTPASSHAQGVVQERRKSDEKEKDKKGKIKKDPEVKKSGWHWRRGAASEEKEREKEKKKEEEAKRKTSKSYGKTDKPHDNARLDLLQTSIDGQAPAKSKERESLVLDRPDVDEELRPARKEQLRKSSSPPPKKEKETSLFSSIFGGSKKKSSSHDSHSRKHSRSRVRSPSPEIKYYNLKADVDYNWTRFSIMEERAIYRMAHLKLANPRRALYSQVLLSNFMYSYLAKVQQMHPHMALPTSPAKLKAKKKDTQQSQNHGQQKATDDPSHYQDVDTPASLA